MHRWLRNGLVAAVAGAAAIQLVPYGRDHADGRPAALDWPTDDVAARFDAACADCHTEQTDWPWYSNVAPVSWLVQRDVERGRDAWNLSDEVDDLDDAAEAIEDGSMPPVQYRLAHAGARLSDEERAALVAALERLDAVVDHGGSSGRGRGRGRGRG